MNLTKREIATLRAALYYWELQGVMSECETAHRLAKLGGNPLQQFERDALETKLLGEMTR